MPDAVLTALGFAALCAPLFVNLAALAVLALTRYWMAFGALAALAVTLPAGLCLAVAFGLAVSCRCEPNAYPVPLTQSAPSCSGGSGRTYTEKNSLRSEGVLRAAPAA